MKRIFLICVLLIFIMGCSRIQNNSDQFHQRMEPDWADFVVLNGITYGVKEQHVGRKVTSEDVGSEFGEVKYRLSGNVYNPHNYQVKDGDASYLDVGTKIYEVKGYNPQYRLAAYWKEDLILLTSIDNPNAKKGSDIFDIKDKVIDIGINDAWDGKTELARISDKTKVSYLTDIVLNAEINRESRGYNGNRYFICFYLKDGTAESISYYIDEGYLSPGIILPNEFQFEIKQILTEFKNK